MVFDLTEVVKVTSKGQLTLPVKMRNSIGLEKGSYLLVEQVGDYILMKKAEIRMKEIQKIFNAEAKKKNITKAKLLKTLNEVQGEQWTS